MTHRVTHAIAGSCLCAYGLISATHTVAFWTSLLGLPFPHITDVMVDALYHAIAVILVPHYLADGGRFIARSLGHASE